MKINLSKWWALLFVLIAITSTTSAQDTTVPKKKWQFILIPYGMFPTMDGTIGMGTLPDADIHATASDIFDHLQFGAMLYAEMYSDRWAFTSDIIYMDLKQDIEGKHGIVSGEAGAQQFVWELAALRKLNSWFDAGIGFRLVNINSDLMMSVDATVPGGPRSKSKSISETWFDPLIIGRAKFDAANKWFFQLRADLGGFGIGSDFTWQAHGIVDYRFSKLFQLTGGYRIISLDYENGTGMDHFLYDMNLSGPVIRFGFNL